MYNRKILNNKFILIFMLIFYIVSSLFQAKTASAHSVYYLAVTVDISSYLYTGSVIQDDESFWSKESKHLEYDVGDFSDVVMDNNSIPDLIDGDTIDTGIAKGDDALAFSLPAKEKDDNHATDEDIDMLYLALDTVVNGLNESVMFLNNYENPKSWDELEKITVQLLNYTTLGRSSGTMNHDGKEYSIQIGVPSGFKVKTGFKKTDYVTITRTEDSEKIVVPFQLKKTGENLDYNSKYFSWGGFALHAAKAHDEKIYTQNVSTLTKPSKVTELITEFIGWMVNDLRSLLGLYSLNDLVFNEGSRGTSIYVHGIAPKAWIDNALTYHMIFQGFAISLLMFSIVKTLLQRNIATVNTNVRVSLIEGFQNIIVAAILLALIIPLMNSLMYLNVLITSFFGETVPDYTALGDTTSYTNLLGGVIMQLVYFGIGLYYNFIYIIRSVTLTILIAIVPLFIVVFAFGGQWKSYFWQWFKEFVANVFMQSFHALMLSLFYSFTLSTRGIEGIVVLIAIIPLSNFFRSMIFGGAGDNTSALGMNTLGMVANLGSSAVNMGSKIASKGVEGAESLKDKLNNNKSADKASAGVSNSATSKASSNASKLKTMTTKGGDTAFDGRANMESVGPQFNGAENGAKTSAAQLQNRINDKTSKLGGSIVKQKAAKYSKALPPTANALVGAGKMVTGASSALVGASMAMALGAEDFNMVKAGRNIGNTGIEQLNDGSKAVLKEGKAAAKTGIDKTSFGKRDKIDATQYQNGDIEVNETMSSFKSTGKGQAIKDAYVDGNNNQVIAYDTKQMDSNQAKMLQKVKTAFSDGSNQDEIDYYKRQGIENVLVDKNNPNNVALVYNQQGKKSMGLKHMNFDHQTQQVNYAYSAGGQIGESKNAAFPPIMPYDPNQNPKNFNRNKNKN